MKDIDYRLLDKSDCMSSYMVYLRGRKLGKIIVTKEDSSAVIRYDFDEKEFSSFTGILLINEILISALNEFLDCDESKIYFKENQLVDYYDDVFAINKKEENNNKCYYLKR